MEDWINDIYNRNDIDIIYMDFKAAFDKVPHKRLLKNMESWHTRQSTKIDRGIYFMLSSRAS